MKILVVDDEFVALTKMVTMLGAFGTCEAATNGRQAFEMFSEALMMREPFDLITIDINMPELDGLGLLERMHLSETNTTARPARKIIITAEGDAETVRAAGRRKCDAYLVKPVNRETLTKKLIEFGFKPTGQRQEEMGPGR